MAKAEYLTTISIDTNNSTFHFYSMLGNERKTIEHHVKSYSDGAFGNEFFARFKEIVVDYAKNNPSDSVRKVTVVLPDNAVLTDTFRVPTMKGLGQTKKALETTLTGLYKNYNDLRIVAQTTEQNKQSSTYVIAAVKKSIISSIYAAFSESKMLVDTITYASCATINGAAMLHSKLKNATYLFLDVKDVYSRFVFVANGIAVGSYTLPFGLELLRSESLIPEDMLFDHSYAELAILNAKERARSQELTVMTSDETHESVANDGSNEAVSAEPTPDAESEQQEAFETDEEPQTGPKIFVKKTPRKLPKFMVRDIPETKEGIVAENFRVFVKWTLTLMKENTRLTALGKPAFVCVNLPLDLMGVLDVANEEAGENGITFVPFLNKEDAFEIANLELYGGFFSKQLPEAGKF